MFGANSAPGVGRLHAGGVPLMAPILSIVVAWPKQLGGCGVNPRVPSGIIVAGPGGAEVPAGTGAEAMGRYCLCP